MAEIIIFPKLSLTFAETGQKTRKKSKLIPPIPIKPSVDKHIKDIRIEIENGLAAAGFSTHKDVLRNKIHNLEFLEEVDRKVLKGEPLNDDEKPFFTPNLYTEAEIAGRLLKTKRKIKAVEKELADWNKDHR